ncbi:stabilizer of axonemal microtubules 5-like [Haliotis cracherodii]|uniref:stabilizer of axonemal microtubules 5-like n=1 Tax=Haliotis cracherodii TaxID=6455 RepID=UPI0039E8E4AC
MAPPAVNVHAEPGTFPPTQSHLGPSNFTFSQDPGVIKSSMCSVFKNDYPSHPHYGRCEKAQPPKLGDVMHQDDRYFSQNESETSKCFEYRYLKKPVLLNVHSKLSQTNFKMDRDTNKFKCFSTTHDNYFTPQMDENYERAKPVLNTTASHIPQGDMEKAEASVSDYRGHFLGHDTRQHKVEKAPSMHQGPPTIKGDPRMTHFDTSTGDQFPGKWQPRVKPFPAPTGTSVPDGDTLKIVMRETTTGQSFPYRGDASSFKPYSSEAVSKMLYQTNLKERDGFGTWNDYVSTASTSFKPKDPNFVRFVPKQHRNHSDFPEGDRQPARDVERVSMTTNKFYHGNPPRGLHNQIVSGANFGTRSNVWFGDPVLGQKSYSTSTGDVFKPKTVPYSHDRTKFHLTSAVPLKYYSSWQSEPTTLSDYQDPKQGKIVPQEEYLDNLRKSHFFPPLKEAMFFHTTHGDLFTPKTSEKYTYDSGRLQKSSVPLGTMQMSANA